MRISVFASRIGVLVLLPGLSAALTGCASQRSQPLGSHYAEFGAAAPRMNLITHCSGYGCRDKTRFTFSEADIGHLRNLMIRENAENSPIGERRGLAQAIAWMEDRVGRIAGTTNDRPGIDFFAASEPGQEDCVDEATNTSSYLLVLRENGLVFHHDDIRIVTRGNMLKGIWPHYGVQIKERVSGREYVLDSGVGKNGTPPAILPARAWFAKGG